MTRGVIRDRALLPAVERLRARLAYDPETGELTWKFDPASPRGNRHVGKRAGNMGVSGYAEIGFDGGVYASHRVIWALVTGAWPMQQIDHINGDKGCNRWANLREVSNSLNQQNLRQAKAHNKSGLLGVRIHQAGRFTSTIVVDGKRTHLGSFSTGPEAQAAYLSAKRQLHEGSTL